MNYTVEMEPYWNRRFQNEGYVWGDSPSKTAEYALEIFRRNKVYRVLVPGSGYGRNTKLFSASGFDVTGIEISEVACQMAAEFDPQTKHYHGSILHMSSDNNKYDAIYCYNVLHLFRERERKLFLRECADKVREDGLMFFTVFSEREPSFGKNREVEKNTFESRPGRPVHYYTQDDLQEDFKAFKTLETGIVEEPEDHSGEPHTHILRYILVRKLPEVTG